MRWQANVTVAAIVEENDRFLLVEENVDGGIHINQPAGHWEFGESLLEAVKRETLEETGWQFEPQSLLGIYHWDHPRKQGLSFLRFAFIGWVFDFDPQRKLDTGIIQTRWLSREELGDSAYQPRSPQVLQCMDDYLAGQRFDLGILKQVKPVPETN